MSFFEAETAELGDVSPQCSNNIAGKGYAILPSFL